MALTGLDIAVAVGTFLAFFARNAEAAVSGHPYNVFWMCDFAAGLLVPAILRHSPTLAAACFICLLPGSIVWFCDALMGGGPWRRAARITGVAMHGGGLAAAVYAICRSGYAPDGWKAALVLQGGLFLFSWIVLPARENVNAVRRVPLGWDLAGGGRRRFLILSGIGLVSFAFIGQAVMYGLSSLVSR